MVTLERTYRQTPIADVPVGAYFYDDRNDEVAVFEGRMRDGTYSAYWPSLESGYFVMFDTDGTGKPTTLELLRVVD